MNTKTLYLNLLAVALMLGAGTAHAARPMPLADAIRFQMNEASERIQADIGATVKEQPLVLDVPGVEIGEIEVVDVDSRPGFEAKALLDSAEADLTDALRRDLMNKALEVPGMFGVYRYMAASALTVAIIVAE